MKRSHGLIQLSREHHTALVLAKRARRAAAATADAVRDCIAAIGTAFATELEPHFRIEEDALLPALAELGHSEAMALVEQTLAEHAFLRALAARLAAGDERCLDQFGEALAAHVRFEEQVLFPAAESTLAQEVLDAVRRC